jgi:hypothetical protein
MSKINETLSRLRDLLEKEVVSFDLAQRLQFDWLQTINAQLDQCLGADDGADATREPSNVEPTQPPSSPVHFPAKQPEASPAHDPIVEVKPTIPPHSKIRFVDDASLMLLSSGSSDSDCEDLIPLSAAHTTFAQSAHQLTQSATDFHEKWREMLDQKRAAPAVADQPIVFGFEKEDFLPEAYEISEGSEDDDDDNADDDIYESNPVEVHGKTIPSWARGDELLRQLKKQRRVDPNTIFHGFTADCSLPEIFNTQKPRWENRADSGLWDPDRVTPEEEIQFKTAVGLD